MFHQSLTFLCKIPNSILPYNVVTNPVIITRLFKTKQSDYSEHPGNNVTQSSRQAVLEITDFTSDCSMASSIHQTVQHFIWSKTRVFPFITVKYPLH